MTQGRVAAVAAALVALGLAGTAWTWRTGAVGGSDSACHALMSQAFAAGRWQPESRLALSAPWPDPTRVAAPGGFLPSAARAGAAVPICTPGYGLLVAPIVWAFGASAVHVVPPIAAGVLVWVSFSIARFLSGPWAGLAAAVLVASHPIVVFQAVQPMNDAATAALWVAATAAMVRRRPALTGALIGLGVLVRPNLALGAVAATVMSGMLASQEDRASGVDEHQGGSARWRGVVRASVETALAATPGVVVALVLNHSLYGSPLQSGYGELGTLFSGANVAENLRRYGATWLATSTPVVLLALGAPWVLGRTARHALGAIALMTASLGSVYLPYRTFHEWWYLRFLLPAVVLSIVLAAATLVRLAARVPTRLGVVAAALLVVAAALGMQRSAFAVDAFALQRLEARFSLTASTVAAHLPPEGVAITVWPSGAIRFTSGHEVVMWDALDPVWLDRAIAWLQALNRPVAIVIETWEEDAFRTRFAGQAFGALDWPPRFDIDRRVRIYTPEDREAYRRGATVATERVFAPRARR
jgi:Dolichyl-phosphate-mannose-protein mannosyltransferase